MPTCLHCRATKSEAEGKFACSCCVGDARVFECESCLADLDKKVVVDVEQLARPKNSSSETTSAAAAAAPASSEDSYPMAYLVGAVRAEVRAQLGVAADRIERQARGVVVTGYVDVALVDALLGVADAIRNALESA